MPASLRCSYKCPKPPTPKLDRAGLLRRLRTEISPDRDERVKFVPGVIRGKKVRIHDTMPCCCFSHFLIHCSVQFKEKKKPQISNTKEERVKEEDVTDYASKLSQSEIEEYERFFANATMDDLRTMADILGVTYQASY